MKGRRKKKEKLSPPALGRNLAVRPGAGPHTPAPEKRKAERLRREIDDQQTP